MKQILLLCALSLGFFVGHAQEKAAKDITVDEILENYFENTGGYDAWKSLTGTRMEAKMSQMGMEFPGVMVQAAPDKQWMEISIQGQKMIQAYDGETAWWINPFMGAPDAQPMPAEMAEQFSGQTFESPLMDYKEKGHTLEYTGQKEVDGIMTHELHLTKKDGKEEYHYFEPEYFVPIMVKMIVAEGAAKGQAMEMYFSNYEEVDGIMMPMSIESKMNGATQFSMTITKIELNPELDETMFDYPKGK